MTRGYYFGHLQLRDPWLFTLITCGLAPDCLPQALHVCTCHVALRSILVLVSLLRPEKAVRLLHSFNSHPRHQTPSLQSIIRSTATSHYRDTCTALYSIGKGISIKGQALGKNSTLSTSYSKSNTAATLPPLPLSSPTYPRYLPTSRKISAPTPVL